MDPQKRNNQVPEDLGIPGSSKVNDKTTSSILSYPMNSNDKKIIERVSDEFLFTKIMDLLWYNIFHYRTLFESLDGVTTTLVGTGTAVIDGSKLTLTTTTGASDSTGISKTPLYQNLLSFAYPSKMRSNFLIDTVTNHVTYIVVGSVAGGTYYGFKIVGGGSTSILYGVTKDGSTENAVQLLSPVAVNTSYDIEARYIPKVGVIFLVDSLKPSGSVKKVTSVANLPSYAFTTSTKLYDIKITNSTGAARALKLSFFEYIQTIVNAQ